MGSLRAQHDFQDCWRIVCALTVVLSHCVGLKLLPGNDLLLARLAHLAVVVFFVISGFAVASSAPRYPNPIQFLAARWSRLWSLAIPMVIFALVLDLLHSGPTNALYPNWQYSKWYAHLGVNLLFLGEFWGATYRPFSIIPYWSLAYEFWYYCLFALWLLPKSRARTALIICVVLIMGPRMWLLLPCWLLGAAIHVVLNKKAQLAQRSRPLKLAGFQLGIGAASLGFIAILALYVGSGFDAALGQLTVAGCETLEKTSTLVFKCGYSKWFLSDYPVALAFAALLFCLNPKSGLPANSAGRFIRWFAPLTFGIYLAHYTLILAALTHLGELPVIWQGILAVLAVVCVATLLGLLFERTRPVLRRSLESFLERFFGQLNVSKGSIV